MKAKPDLSGILQPPGDLDAFLEGGAVDQVGRLRRPPMATNQKLFRLRWDTCEGLKVAAQRDSETKGRRVTETELAERAIRKFLKLDSF